MKDPDHREIDVHSVMANQCSIAINESFGERLTDALQTPEKYLAQYNAWAEKKKVAHTNLSLDSF